MRLRTVIQWRVTSSQTFAATDAAELAVLERSGFVESRHVGAAIVLNPDGSVARSLGDVETAIFPRSCLKPLQAATTIALGAKLTGVERALATASHAGTDAHVAVVLGMLERGGFSVDDLQCPTAWPIDAGTRNAMVRADEGPSRIRMNCSGKHAAMLLACRAQGWDTATYLDPAHPLQQAIATTVVEAAGEPISAVGVDGCGAPVLGLSLHGLARALRWATAGWATAGWGGEAVADAAVAPLETAAAQVMAAVAADPWAIHGLGLDNTTVIAELGTFAKGGAEGVMVMTAPSGHVVAVKILDGSSRAASVVALDLLVSVGSLSREAVDATLPLLHLDVTGGDAVVGRVRSVV